jgi:hypothetical protein
VPIQSADFIRKIGYISSGTKSLLVAFWEGAMMFGGARRL